MLRSVVAVVAGFVLIGLLVTVTDQVMARLLPDLFPADPTAEPIPTPALLLNAAYGFVYAIVGGYVTAWMAPGRVMRHIWWLAGAIVVLGLVSAAAYMGILPLWYSLLIIVLGVIGVYLGGQLFGRRATAAAA